MNVLAVLLLTVWSVGVVAFTAVLPALIRKEPLLSIAFDLKPVPVGLLLTVVVVFWPAAFGARVLSAAVDRLR